MTASATRTAPPDLRIKAVDPHKRVRGEQEPFLTLPAADKAALERLAELAEYATAGATIFSQGEKARFLHLLADGVAEASRGIESGDRQVLAFYWPGDLFGLPEAGTYVNSVRTLTPCTVYRFPRAGLEALLLERPQIQHGFLTKAVHDLRNAQRQLIVMGRFNVARRLAAFLVDCAGHEQYFDGATRVLTLPMTRYDIADYLGTSAESITRAFGQLEQQDLLQRLTVRTVKLSLARLKALYS